MFNGLVLLQQTTAHNNKKSSPANKTRKIKSGFF
jgi:hypothetical protein